MDTYFRILCGALIASLLLLSLPEKGKTFAVLLTMGTCVMALLAGFRFLEPILDFLRKLRQTAGLPDDYLRLLLKVLTVGLSSELASSVCNLSGAPTLGKTVELVGAFLIVSFTVPLYAAILELIQKLVGSV